MTERAPAFVHRRPLLEALRRVFSLFQAPTADVENLVSCAVLVRNSTTLLQGIYGTGKTQLVQLLHAALFGDQDGATEGFGYLACTQDLTPTDALFAIDVAKLVQGEEVVRPREIVTAPLKFVNEFQRASSLLHNALLPLLAEGRVAFREHVFESPPFVCFLDANPQDAGSTEVPKAFVDRIDYSIELPVASTRGLLRLQETFRAPGGGMSWEPISDRISGFLGVSRMEEIWSDVSRVEIGPETRALSAMVAATLQRCIVVDRSVVSDEFSLPCSRCSFRGDPCSKLARVPGSRFVLSMLRLSQARAWLRGASEVAIEDLLWALPHTLGHRLELRSDARKLWPGTRDWILEELYRGSVRSRIPRWRQVLSILEESPERSSELQGIARRDLAIAGLLEAGR